MFEALGTSALGIEAAGGTGMFSGDISSSNCVGPSVVSSGMLRGFCIPLRTPGSFPIRPLAM